MIEQVWSGAPASDDSLFRSISDIRIALTDDRSNPRWIRTAPKAGYQFIGRVEEVSRAPVVSEKQDVRPRRVSKRRLLASALVAVSVSGAIWYFGSRRPAARFSEVAWWRFDDKAGKRVADSAKNGTNPGAIAGVSFPEVPVHGPSPPGSGRRLMAKTQTFCGTARPIFWTGRSSR